MHNLCPNPRNYLGKYFNHILEYLQIEPSKYTKLWYNLVLTNCHISGLAISICRFRGYSCIFLGTKLKCIFFDTYDYACGEKLVHLHINVQLLKRSKKEISILGNYFENYWWRIWWGKAFDLIERTKWWHMSVRIMHDDVDDYMWSNSHYRVILLDVYY